MESFKVISPATFQMKSKGMLGSKNSQSLVWMIFLEVYLTFDVWEKNYIHRIYRKNDYFRMYTLEETRFITWNMSQNYVDSASIQQICQTF